MRFGSFVLNPDERSLSREGEAVQITPKALDALVVLVQNRGRVVTKDELMDVLWPDSVVEENNLVQAISAVRKALGDNPLLHNAIATIPGRGYRFVASAEEVGAEETAASPRGPRTAPEPAPAPEERGAPSEAASGSPHSRFGRALWAIVMAAAIAVVIYLWLPRSPGQATESADSPTIAILPFRTLGEDPGFDYLGVGFADALITKLGNTRQLVVRPTSAILRYTDSSRDPIAIGHTLQVGAILDGSIRRIGDRVRVTVQLLSVEKKGPIWGDTFDETSNDLFSLEDAISREIVASLHTALGARAGGLTHRVYPGSDAYEEFLRGRYFREKITVDGFRQSIEHFQRAIDMAPGFAPAYAGMAGCYCLLSGNGIEVEEPRKAMTAAKAAALKALELDPDLPEAHAALGMIRLKYDWDFAGAERSLSHATDLNPSYAEAHLWYSIYLEAMGRTAEAVAASERAWKLDPLSLRYNVNVATQYARAGRHDEAIERIERTLELDSSYWMAHWLLGDVRLQQGMVSEAITALERAAALSGRNPAALSSLGVAYATSGRAKEANDIIDELRARGKETYISPAGPAAVYAALGDRDRAFEWLEKSFEARSRSLVWLEVLPQFDILRDDPRFAELLRRIGSHPG